MRRGVAPTRRHGLRQKPAASRRWPATVLVISITAVVAITGILLDPARSVPGAVPFGAREVEQAKLEVLPFRQSGLVFHWADDAPSVYVKRSMWNALPAEARRKLGRSMAVAKNRLEITVFDETLVARIAVCTAREGCTPVPNDPRPPTR